MRVALLFIDGVGVGAADPAVSPLARGLPHAAPFPSAPLPIPPGRLRRLKPSASTVAYAPAGVPLRTLGEAERGPGLTRDIEGRRARLRGLSVRERSPEEAAEVLWRIAGGHDFVLFEHLVLSLPEANG